MPDNRIQELEQRIAGVKYDIFMIDMKDRWDDEDRKYADQLYKTLNELKSELEELKKQCNTESSK